MKKYFLNLIFILIFSGGVSAQKPLIHHSLFVNINPSSSFIEVTDEVTATMDLAEKGIEFFLNKDLSVKSLTDGIRFQSPKRYFNAGDVGMDRDFADDSSGVLLKKYIVTIPKNLKDDFKFGIGYSGKISSPIEQSQENYQRGFSESSGIIDTIGIYLAGSTYWSPTFDEDLSSFSLSVKLPEGWRSVSQGSRTAEETKGGFHYDTWESPTPQEEIFLIGAKFNEYKFDAGAVAAMAFLRTPDEALANKYLETTAQYLEMYRQLIGPFPYTKFALVENFWETGYGMPSFTLLGEKIIRFPFILHSSYPHELLHNWWGNSVYVDFKYGNWCEGLTAYMADHLIKEQRGQGEEYRMSTLQRFTDYVNETNDFPLSKFISRFDGASEAVGYGKALMMFHMLRLKVGDEQFEKAFQVFYRNNKFKFASYDDIRSSFEEVTGSGLKWFFDQWVNRTGAPELVVSNASVSEEPGGYTLHFRIDQIQKDEPFIVDVPITFVFEDGSKTTVYHITERKTKFSLTTDRPCLKLIVDPQFDVFRRLDPKETPSSFSKAYGADKKLMILPDKGEKDYSIYKNFAESWSGGNEKEYEIIDQNEIGSIPADKAVWILGFENKFSSLVSEPIKNFNSAIRKDFVEFQKTTIEKGTNSFFISVKNSQNPDNVLLLLDIGNEAAIPGLVRKLPHYGKYSYLAFEGDEPANIAKGQWLVTNSPLSVALSEDGALIQPKFEKREALAQLTPVFSSERMLGHIHFLASDELKGRGLGTPELDKAASYIANKFKEYGLKPGAGDGTYFQKWSRNFENKGNMKLQNVIGLIPGTDPELKDRPVVISAHFDHLGLGWPDVYKGNEGKIHPGADDNASGVSVLLELAKIMGGSLKPARTVIFIAFTAEEAGLIGSRYFVENYKLYPAQTFLADLNLDTVGRLFGKKVMILNSSSAREWKFIFMGTEYTTGVKSELIAQDLDASDQKAFIEIGIPAVQLFSGPHSDYHRPGDTEDKIDPDGLVKIAAISKETIEYLAGREEPMEFVGEISSAIKQEPKDNTKKNQGRRVSTGTMPDFAFAGEGVKIAAVSPGSPAEKAGLQTGDVIIKFDGHAVKNLREYSDLLKQHQPGDVVELVADRSGEIIKAKLILAER